jgi:Family of unknown function (DUF5309)
MAVPVNTNDRFGAVGVREDLADMIYLVAPETVPTYSMAARDPKTAEQTFHEYLRDTLRSPNPNNAAIEGDDATNTAKTPEQRVANFTQISQDTWGVSGTVEAVKKAGRGSELGKYRAKAFIEVKRDIEAALASQSRVAAAGATGATGRSAAGLGVHIFTNVSHGVGGATAAHTSGAPTTAPTVGTLRAFTEAQVKSIQQSMAINAGEQAQVLMLSPAHKGVFSGFAGIAQTRFDVKGAEQSTIIGGADVYMGDFGKLVVVPNWIMAQVSANTAYMINKDYIRLAFLSGRKYKVTPLAKTGDNMREQGLCEWSLEVSSERAHGKIADLTATGV